MDDSERIAELRRALEAIRDRDPLEGYRHPGGDRISETVFMNHATVIESLARTALEADDDAAAAAE
jgi:hypothetical protein